MTNLDIKKEIDNNNRIIESVMQPNVWTLNNTVAKLLIRNKELQNKCIHHFVDGFCEYCYKEESVND